MDTTAIDHVLSTTRAVRKRLDLDRPVEREVILECLRLAIQAPTGSNRQDWRFIVVTDAVTRARLADIYDESPLPYLGVRAEDGRGPSNPVRDSAVYLSEVLHRVPVHVIPCVMRRPEPDDPRGTRASTAPSSPPRGASCSRCAHEGSGRSGPHSTFATRRTAAELLGIPDGVSQVALIPVAYTIGDQFKPASRPPVQTVVSWDHWGATGG